MYGGFIKVSYFIFSQKMSFLGAHIKQEQIQSSILEPNWLPSLVAEVNSHNEGV